MIRLLVFCLFSLCTVAASAATCTSRQNGNWSQAGQWNCGAGSSNGPPATGDVVVVNHNITLNGDTNTLASLTVNSGKSITNDTTSSRTINLTGNLVLDGSVNASSGGIYPRLKQLGASSWSGNGSLYLDYLDVNNQSITLSTASTMGIFLNATDSLLNVNGGSFNNGASPNQTATIHFIGGAQTLDDYSLKYPNVMLIGGTKTVSSSTFTVLGNLIINWGATLSTDTVTSVNLAGNLVINGTLSSFSGGSSTWTFNGVLSQNISAAAAFRNVVLNNSNGLTLGGNLTVGDTSYGALTLASGKLTTGANSVVIPKNCSGSAITRLTGAWINGNLQLTMPGWASSCIFDVGDSSNYTPITYSYPWNAAPLGGTVTASTTSGDHPDTLAGISGVSATKGVNRYWTLSKGSGSTFYTYDAIFQYCSAVSGPDCTVNDVDSGAIASSFVVAEQSLGLWSSFTPTSPTTNSRQVTGLTAFGPFVMGEAPSACPQPANTPVGMTLSCQCDGFGRAALNPSPIFTNGNWIVSTSGNDTTGIVPYINGTTGFLRLTEKTGNNSKAVTAPGFFPAAGNYVSVEFKHYAYDGNGADGISAILSDYSIPPVPGAPGGSLGFANRNAEVGFAGGWIGVGIDEYGNYSANSEGKHLGPSFRADAVAVRGSGSGTTGYAYLAGTAAGLSPGVDNAGSTSPAYGHYYQVIVDARNYATGQTYVAVNRDTTGTGASYASLIPSFEIFSTAATAGYIQSAVPVNFQLSFTGSTGGAINIHELDSVRICAQYYVPPDGGTAGGFSAIDDAYTSTVQNFLVGHIFTKLAGTAFKLKVAALSNSQILTTYAASGTKNVAVKLVDNSDGLCGTDLTRVTECAKAVCNGKSAVSGGSQTLKFVAADKGIKTSADFTLNSAYANLVAVMTEGAVTACSLDSFSVRPTKITSVTSSNATNVGLTGTPKFKAGTDSFALTATANAAGYTGTPKINTAAMTANPAGGAVGAFTPSTFPAATSGVSTSTATGSFTYGEVGNFRFLGFDPATNTSSARGIYDDSWVTVDSVSTKNDCVAGSYDNAKDANGKYGCLFGLQDSSASAPNSVLFGRFVPDRFAYLGGGVSQGCSSGSFTYMGQAKLGVAYRLQALNGGGGVTTNYSQALGYPVTNPTLVAEDQATANQGCDLASRMGSLATAQWTAGVYNLNDANADNVPETATAVFLRPSVPGPLTLATCAVNKANAGGPFSLLDIGVAMSDSDANAAMAALDMDAGTAGTCSGAGCTARRIGTANLLFGRLRLLNFYGSELLPARMEYRVESWNGTNWITNTADTNCSALAVANIARPAGLGAPAVTYNNGVGLITFPIAVVGNYDIAANLNAAGNDTSCNAANPAGTTAANRPWLQFGWCAGGNRDPNARIRLGSPKAPYIYFRERY